MSPKPQRMEGPVSGIGIDTWGVDFGLLDREWFYQVTGNQFMEINTAFQLLSLKRQRLELLDRSRSLLLMPDLFQYFLSGNMAAECSIASTTQLLEMRKKDWSKALIGKLSLPQSIFQPVIAGGTKTGVLLPQLRTELGVLAMDVIAVAGHDTQSAMAAVPTAEKDFLFISCGTWSLFGTETEEPIINEKSMEYNLTNEAGLEGKYSFLKNIIGLWLVQESRRQWIREGRELYHPGENWFALTGRAMSWKGHRAFVRPRRSKCICAAMQSGRMLRPCSTPPAGGHRLCGGQQASGRIFDDRDGDRPGIHPGDSLRHAVHL